MDHRSEAGFEEIEHTADWQLDVWARTLEELFVQAARGMYALSNIKYKAGDNVRRDLIFEEEDLESLLVAFLTELLFFAGAENLAFDLEQVQVDETRFSAALVGGEIIQHDKEIKAVTYHNLEIKIDNDLYRVSIVFDV